MNAQADIDLVLPCYNPPSGWEEQVATHFREVERLFSPVRFHLFIVSDGSRRGYEPERDKPTDDQREHQRRTGGIQYGIQGPAAGSVELLIHLIS